MSSAARTLDRETPAEARARKAREYRAEEEWRKTHNAATSYGEALRRYAKEISYIVEYYTDPVTQIVPPDQMPALNDALRRYQAGTLPWARAAAARMVKEANRRNLTAWHKHTAEMSFQLQQQLISAPVGETVAELMATQVDLITSLPLEAAARVHEMSLHALTVGSRYPEQTSEIEAALERAHPNATARWLRNRATLIANTEAGRAATVLTQARSEHVGATHYIWRTAGDWKTRPSHQALDRTIQRWDTPPLSDPPDYHAHPGCIWNCRCVALPIIAE